MNQLWSEEQIRDLVYLRNTTNMTLRDICQNSNIPLTTLWVKYEHHVMYIHLIILEKQQCSKHVFQHCYVFFQNSWHCKWEGCETSARPQEEVHKYWGAHDGYVFGWMLEFINPQTKGCFPVGVGQLHAVLRHHKHISKHLTRYFHYVVQYSRHMTCFTTMIKRLKIVQE